MAWLAFASVAMYAALVNFEKFAVLPSSPKDWLQEREDDAIALARKIDSEPGAPRQEDLRNYFWLLLEAANVERPNRRHGHDIAARLAPVRPNPAGYDAEYVERLRRLACGELMFDRVDDMLVTMEHIYHYDKKYFGPSDIRLLRDYNNLGLVCLMVGQHCKDEQVRYGLYRQAADWLQKAESGMPADAKTDLVSIKENQLMLAEAMNDRQLAGLYRHRMDSLLRQINGPAPLVTLD
ncbi:MAG TPA: hypothetical protein V6D22_19880 [Candidatus Obscuribacterales bacterium]